MDTYLLQHTLHCLSKICLHASFFCYFNRKSSGSTALLGDNASHFKQPILIFTIFWGPDECYYRKVSCAITWISTSFKSWHGYIFCYNTHYTVYLKYVFMAHLLLFSQKEQQALLCLMIMPHLLSNQGWHRKITCKSVNKYNNE